MENSKYKNMSFPQVFGGNLPLSKLLLKKEKQLCFMQKVEDPQQKLLGMTPNFTSGLHPTYNSNGFTLIELLVVVLIIGILAAVALPQYQKAVLKARLTQLVTYIKALRDSAEVYYLANGTYPSDVTELDLDITNGGEIKNTGLTSSEHMGVEYPDGTRCYVASTQVHCVSADFSVIYFHPSTRKGYWHEPLIGRTACLLESSPTDKKRKGFEACKAWSPDKTLLNLSGVSKACYLD